MEYWTQLGERAAAVARAAAAKTGADQPQVEQWLTDADLDDPGLVAAWTAHSQLSARDRQSAALMALTSL